MMKYVSRPKTAATKAISSIFWVTNIDIGKGDLHPPVVPTVLAVTDWLPPWVWIQIPGRDPVIYMTIISMCALGLISDGQQAFRKGGT